MKIEKERRQEKTRENKKKGNGEWKMGRFLFFIARQIRAPAASSQQIKNVKN